MNAVETECVSAPLLIHDAAVMAPEPSASEERAAVLPPVSLLEQEQAHWAALLEEHDWMAEETLDGKLFSEVVSAEISLRHELEKRNLELESQWGDLKNELENLRAKREASELEAAEVRRRQCEAESMVKELSASLHQLMQKNQKMGNYWQESAAKYEQELHRLERSKKAMAERNKKLKDELSRKAKDWKNFHSQLPPHAQQQHKASDQAAEKLRELNKLMTSRVATLQEEVKALRGELASEKALREEAQHERDERDLFTMVDTWEREAQQFKLQNTFEELRLEREQKEGLQKELERVRFELEATHEALVASSQSGADSELEVFKLRMELNEREEEKQEALQEVARAREATEDALRARDEAHRALERLLEERSHTRLELARVSGERDFFEWVSLERPSSIEWIEPPEQVIEKSVSDDSWHENELFGTQNLLYESE